jgi:hypothetical protein
MPPFLCGVHQSYKKKFFLTLKMFEGIKVYICRPDPYPTSPLGGEGKGEGGFKGSATAPTEKLMEK